MEQTCKFDYIESKDNKRYKLIKKLSKKKYRDKNNIFIAEGEKFLEESFLFNELIILESMLEYYENKYDLSNMKVIVLKDSLFNEITTQENSQGLILVSNKNLLKLEDIKGDLVILDNIQDPGNVGTIMRTLAALDYENVILTNNSVDVYNPKAVRASMGSIFKLNIVYESYENILEYLKKNEYSINVTALTKDAKDYNKVVLKENKNAYIFGNEGTGVSSSFLDISSRYIIPISSKVNSLNVSVSLAVFLYKIRELENRR